MPEFQPVIDVLVKFAQDVLTLAAPIVAVFVVRWLKAKGDEVYAQLRQTVGEEKSFLLDSAVNYAVWAAEQLKLSGQIQDKKQFAIQFVQSYLAKRGVFLDVSEIAVAIEAAVYTELNAGKKALPTP